jgi:hypothetical protein
LIVTIAVPDIGDAIGGTSLAPDSATSCVFDIPPICPIDVQAPNIVAAANIAIAAIVLRFPSFALIAFLRRNGSSDLPKQAMLRRHAYNTLHCGGLTAG